MLWKDIESAKILESEKDVPGALSGPLPPSSF
jgi:hypothetical protein